MDPNYTWSQPRPHASASSSHQRFPSATFAKPKLASQQTPAYSVYSMKLPQVFIMFLLKVHLQCELQTLQCGWEKLKTSICMVCMCCPFGGFSICRGGVNVHLYVYVCEYMYICKYVFYMILCNIFQSLVSLPSQDVRKPWQFPTVVISTSSPHFPEGCPLKGKVLPKRRGSNRAEIIDSSGLWNSNDCLRFWNHSNASDLGTVLSKTWQSEHRAHKFSREFDVSNRIMPLRYFLPSNPQLDY